MQVRGAELDMAAARPQLPASMRDHADRLELRVAPDDGMESNDVHYLMVGSSALDALQSAVRLGGRGEPRSILDFGSGAGRVTRWLKVAYPDASLSCCDLRPQDVAFCRDVLRVDAWLSSTDVEAVEFRGPYDLIWMGSVLTHVDAAMTRRLVERAMDALNPHGLLVATTLGRVARAVQDREGPYVQGGGWPVVKRGYDESGYGYSDYPAEEGFAPGYGLSLSSLAWVTGLATGAAGRRLVTVSEAAWDGLQDMFALQAVPTFVAAPPAQNPHRQENNALRDRVAALEGSTSWRVTAPLRRLTELWRTARRP